MALREGEGRPHRHRGRLHETTACRRARARRDRRTRGRPALGQPRRNHPRVRMVEPRSTRTRRTRRPRRRLPGYLDAVLALDVGEIEPAVRTAPRLAEDAVRLDAPVLASLGSVLGGLADIRRGRHGVRFRPTRRGDAAHPRRSGAAAVGGRRLLRRHPQLLPTRRHRAHARLDRRHAALVRVPHCGGGLLRHLPRAPSGTAGLGRRDRRGGTCVSRARAQTSPTPTSGWPVPDSTRSANCAVAAAISPAPKRPTSRPANWAPNRSRVRRWRVRARPDGAGVVGAASRGGKPRRPGSGAASCRRSSRWRCCAMRWPTRSTIATNSTQRQNNSVARVSRAWARHWRGSLLCAQGRAADAATELVAAIRLYREQHERYETARAYECLAAAHRASAMPTSPTPISPPP